MSNGYILGRGMRLYLDGITRRREDGRTRLREQLRGARLAGNDWEWLGMTGRRANKTTGPRDCETTRLRDYGTTGLRDHGKHRRSQAFSGVLSRARLCEAVRGCAWLCVAVRGCAWQCEAAWRQSGADVVHRKREYHGIVLKRTARGTLLFGMYRRCAAITSSKKKEAIERYSTRPRVPRPCFSNKTRLIAITPFVTIFRLTSPT